MAEFKKRLGALWAKESQYGVFYSGSLEVEESIREKIAQAVAKGEKVAIQLQSVKPVDGKKLPAFNIVLNEWNKNESSKPVENKPAQPAKAKDEDFSDCPF